MSIEQKYQSIVQANEDRKMFVMNSNYYEKINAELKSEFRQNMCNAIENENFDRLPQILNASIESTMATVCTQFTSLL